MPVGAGEEVLDAIGGGVAELFSELPTVLAFSIAEECPDVGDGSESLLEPRKVPRDSLSDVRKFVGPACHIGSDESS